MKNIINKTLMNTFGYHISKYRSKKDVIFETQKKLCETNRRVLIFDVGAYTGETALAYNKYFNNHCDIISFEPFKASYDQLLKNTAALKNVKSINSALSNMNGKSYFHVNNFLATNSLLPSSQKGIEIWGAKLLETKAKVEVAVVTIDQFVKDNQIEQIDILKMDAQGAEYLIMEGAQDSIRQGKIKVIFSELIVMPIYEGQKELHEMLALFNSYGFELYNLFTSNDQQGKVKFMDGIFVFKN